MNCYACVLGAGGGGGGGEQHFKKSLNKRCYGIPKNGKATSTRECAMNRLQNSNSLHSFQSCQRSASTCSVGQLTMLALSTSSH